MEQIVQDFLLEQKIGWIKKRKKEGDQRKVLSMAEELFEPSSWVEEAAVRAPHITARSHVEKLTDPDAIVSPFVVSAEPSPDGLVRSGNVEYAIDLCGSNAYNDVAKFLDLSCPDGRNILDHLRSGSSTIKKYIKSLGLDYKLIRESFLSVIKDYSHNTRTSSRVKQVYFPMDLEESYHQVSIITPPGLVYEMKQRINHMHFGEERDAARKARREGREDRSGIDEIYGLVTVFYGGSQPGNLGFVNCKKGNNGRAYMLPSLPPRIDETRVRLPRTCFLTDCIWHGYYREEFSRIHRLLTVDYKNKNIKDGIYRIMLGIFDDLVSSVWEIRSLEGGWSDRDNYSSLTSYQKILLDSAYSSGRDGDEGYVDRFIEDAARWILMAYKRETGKDSVELGDDVLTYVIRLISREHRESLL